MVAQGPLKPYRRPCLKKKKRERGKHINNSSQVRSPVTAFPDLLCEFANVTEEQGAWWAESPDLSIRAQLASSIEPKGSQLKARKKLHRETAKENWRRTQSFSAVLTRKNGE